MAKALSSQDLLSIKEIRDGVLILKNGGLRAVLICSSINFALKSQDEQNAVIFQYQNFLNSLDFSVQFFLESRKLNIEPYLMTLKEAEKKQTNDLLKIQIAEYSEFVRTFVKSANIVTKSFFAVVPFTPPLFTTPQEGVSSILGGISGAFSKKADHKETGLTPEKFEEFKNQLWQRADSVIQGLIRTGVRAVPLNTEELIELFYSLYNPGELEKGKPPAIGLPA